MPHNKGCEVRIQQQIGAAHAEHAQEDVFNCRRCGKHYIYRSSLVRHQKLECGKEPQFQCPYCPKKSKLKSNLKQHIILKHERPTARMQ